MQPSATPPASAPTQPVPQVTFQPGRLHDEAVIFIRFDYDAELVKRVRTLTGVRWSKSEKAWYVKDNDHYRQQFKLPPRECGKEALAKVSATNRPAHEIPRPKGHPLFKGEGVQLIPQRSVSSRAIKEAQTPVPPFSKGVAEGRGIHTKPSTNVKHSTMLKMCYGMGLRVSEIVALKVKHIDSGNMQVLIEKAKGKKDRYVNLPESILAQLREYFKEYRPKEYLFEGQYGGQYSIRSAQNVFKNALVKAGINKDTGIHSLRHSYATHLMEAGTDIGHIQKLLGHANITTTLIYAKVTDRDTKKVKSPLDSL